MMKEQNDHDHFSAFELKKQRLLAQIQANPSQKLSLHKKTASNLFRYAGKQNNRTKHSVAIKDFDNILSIDIQNHILDVEGLTPYEKIVHFTLQHQLLPTVAPELKHITIGGAIVGIGIESTSYQYGFVHDGLLEAEVLLPDGRIIICNATNEYADLFQALPNSYGTLGYILRAKIKLYSAKPFVQINIQKFSEARAFIDNMKNATDNPAIHFIEGFTFSMHEHYLMLGQFREQVEKTDDIYTKNIFYQLVKNRKVISLTTEDYIFRYDPDWFWNIPETGIYSFLRRIAPKKWRNSGLYKLYIDKKKQLLTKLALNPAPVNTVETLIQDWEVPWENGYDLLQFALSHININNKPWVVVPIKPIHTAILYPLKPNELYFNLGCYCSSEKSPEQPDPYYNTKLMDHYCFSLSGLKMLYSSTFITQNQFSNYYNGNLFNDLKSKYDPQNINNTLYHKTGCFSDGE